MQIYNENLKNKYCTFKKQSMQSKIRRIRNLQVTNKTFQNSNAGIAVFGTRYTKTSCISIHTRSQNHNTYAIILGLQLSIVVQQNFINFSHNFAKFSQIFLKLSLILLKVFLNFLIFSNFSKLSKTIFKTAQNLQKIFNLIIIFKNLFLNCPKF